MLAEELLQDGMACKLFRFRKLLLSVLCMQCSRTIDPGVQVPWDCVITTELFSHDAKQLESGAFLSVNCLTDWAYDLL